MRAYRGFADLFPHGRGTEPRPVWVSRSRLPPPRRAIAGEKVLEEHLADWRIVHPQELSMAEQIEVFSKHTTYAGMIGSAMHNILFSRSPRVTYLTVGEPNLNFLMCDELVGADSLYVGCCDEGGLPSLGRQTPLRLDLARAGEALSVAIDPSLQLAVDERHREMWADVRLRQGLRRRDRSTLREVRRHYSGPLTPRLARLARELPTYAPRKGRRSARAWAADLVRPRRG